MVDWDVFISKTYTYIDISNRLICILQFLGCGSPELATDNYCNDENNKVGCDWDGGACCNNHNDGWDTFCTECKCLGN